MNKIAKKFPMKKSLTKRHAKAKRPNRGFSMMELMISLAIIAVLIGGFLTVVDFGIVDDAKADSARKSVNDLGSHIERYKNDIGQVPTAEQGLKALKEKPSDLESNRYRPGGYIKDNVKFIDAWGTELLYAVPGEEREFDLCSLGADKIEGGEGFDADICYPASN